MLIFAKKKLEFAFKDQTWVVPKINDFVEAPGWITKSDLYKLAITSGDVRAAAPPAEEQITAEEPPVTPTAKKPPRSPKPPKEPEPAKEAETGEPAENSEGSGEAEKEDGSEGADGAQENPQ